MAVLVVPTASRPRSAAALDGPAVMHLLRSYASVVAVRPLLVGNREFLDALLSACRTLADALDETDAATRSIRDRLDRLRIDNAVHVAKDIVRLVDDAAVARDEPLFVQGIRPPTDRYDRITVVFGPGIGLGDEITFVRVVRALSRRWPDAQLVVYTLYPGLWRQLLPGVDERHYRLRPLRPFVDLKAREGDGRQLVVVADFELFDLAANVIPRRRGRDVFELSLGRRHVRQAPGDSPWTRWETFDGDDPNNYETVAAMARRLVGESPEDGEAWSPLRSLRPADATRRVRRLLLNPLSSKPLPFGVEGWAALVDDVGRRLPRDTQLELTVYPGLHASTEAYADALCRLLPRAQPLRTRDGGMLTPTNTAAAVVDALAHVDVCLTVDTFTAHLAPLYGVPTATIAYYDNRPFWPPAPWALTTLFDDAEAELPQLVARLLLRGRVDGAGRAAAELAAATRRAGERGIGRETVDCILQPLARCIAGLDADFPYAAEGRRWLALWSRVGSAVRRDPLPPEQLRPFIREWRRSQFFRLVSTSQPSGWSG